MSCAVLLPLSPQLDSAQLCSSPVPLSSLLCVFLVSCSKFLVFLVYLASLRSNSYFVSAVKLYFRALPYVWLQTCQSRSVDNVTQENCWSCFNFRTVCYLGVLSMWLKCLDWEHWEYWLGLLCFPGPEILVVFSAASLYSPCGCFLLDLSSALPPCLSYLINIKHECCVWTSWQGRLRWHRVDVLWQHVKMSWWSFLGSQDVTTDL